MIYTFSINRYVKLKTYFLPCINCFKLLYSFWFISRIVVYSASRSFQLKVPSNLLISSGGHNFVTLTAELCDPLVALFHKVSKFFKNKLSLKYFSL
jgi:hypothetical protein